MRGDKIKTCLLIIIYYSLIYSILFSLNFKNTYYAKADIPFYRIPGDYICYAYEYIHILLYPELNTC